MKPLGSNYNLNKKVSATLKQSRKVPPLPKLKNG